MYLISFNILSCKLCDLINHINCKTIQYLKTYKFYGLGIKDFYKLKVCIILLLFCKFWMGLLNLCYNLINL